VYVGGIISAGFAGIANYYSHSASELRKEADFVLHSKVTPINTIISELNAKKQTTGESNPSSFYALTGFTFTDKNNIFKSKLGGKDVIMSKVVEVQMVEEDRKLYSEKKNQAGQIIGSRTEYVRCITEIPLATRTQGEVFSFSDASQVDLNNNMFNSKDSAAAKDGTNSVADEKKKKSFGDSVASIVKVRREM
jgi:uncharacterized protein YlxP (DUF503 family)